MKKQIHNYIRTGIIFGAVIIFLNLIGFNTMIGSLLAKAGTQQTSSALPPIPYLVAYLALIGLWIGIATARKSGQTGLVGRMTAGLISGSSAGVLTFLFCLGIGGLLVNKIDLRNYLVVLSLDFIKVTLFGLTPLPGALANLAVLAAAGSLGGLLNGLSHLPGVQAIGKKVRNLTARLFDNYRRASRGNKRTWLLAGWIALIAILVIFLPLRWGSYWNYVTGTVGLYVILGLGLNIIVGLSGQLVLGYIAFFAIGAYTMALLNSPVPHNLMWGFWPALVLGILLAALAGLLLGLPLMRLRGDYLAIVTLGFGEIIRILLKSDVLTDFSGGPRGIQNISGPTLFGRPFNSDVQFMYLIAVSVLLAAFVYNRLQHSRTGRAWLAIREDEVVAKATGVNTTRYKLLALVLGAAFAGLAGAIFASRNQFTGPEEHSLMASINVLSLIIVGGMGNIPGTILGAFALKGLPEILREFANFRLLTFGALLVAMMLFRPEGLIPSKRTIMKLPEESDAAENSKAGDHEH